MVTPPSETSKSKTTDANKFDRIDIWRNEVASSQIYCVCSALAMQAKIAGAREDLFPTMRLPSMAVSSPSTNLDKGAITSLAYPWHEERKQKRPGFLLKASSRLSAPRSPEIDSGECSMCASPTDGIAYRSLSSDGCGLVWRRSDSSRSIASSIKCLEEGGRAKVTRQSLLKTVSQVFRRSKRLDLPRTSSESSQPRQQNIDDATRKPNASETTAAAGLGNEIPGRTTGTEMYHLLRREGRLTINGTDDNAEEVDTFSDDDRKKPRTGIDASAARLDRARKLLKHDT